MTNHLAKDCRSSDAKIRKHKERILKEEQDAIKAREQEALKATRNLSDDVRFVLYFFPDSLTYYVVCLYMLADLGDVCSCLLQVVIIFRVLFVDKLQN